jgi:hypothetical protein
MDGVPDYNTITKYRPMTLANHPDFKHAYEHLGTESTPTRTAIAAYLESRLPPNLTF